MFKLRHVPKNKLILTRSYTKEKPKTELKVSTGSKFKSSCVAYSAAPQVNWGWVGWEMWSFLWVCSLVKVKHDKFDISQLKMAHFLLNYSWPILDNFGFILNLHGMRSRFCEDLSPFQYLTLFGIKGKCLHNTTPSPNRKLLIFIMLQLTKIIRSCTQ